MQNEPGEKPPTPARPKAKVIDDGFVVVEVDGFAQMTPEQRTWPVYPAVPDRPPEPGPAVPAADEG